MQGVRRATPVEPLELEREATPVHSPLGADAEADVADVAERLGQAVPEGWEVSTGCRWSPSRSGDLLLRPAAVVHRPLGLDGGLPAPPALCVTVAPAGLDLRSARVYARLGVDHYWHLDSRDGVLEVLVRVDDDYRHAETLTIAGARPCPGTDAGEWVDFGVGVVRLGLLSDRHRRRAATPPAAVAG